MVDAGWWYRGHGRLDSVHVVIEAHPEVWVVPRDDWPGHLGEQEREILCQLGKAERLVVDRRVDSEAAGVGAAEAASGGSSMGRRLAPSRSP